MNILFIGDVVGKPGRKALRSLLPDIKRTHKIEFIIANAENAAGGRGLTHEVMDELFNLEIDVLTMGNHVWDNKEIYNFIENEKRLIRPANYPPDCPGQGYGIYRAGIDRKIAVVNLMGRVFLQPLDCPFRVMEELLQEIKEQADIIIVDFHAEATSEKLAFAHYFDGRLDAVLGTHTHVQTADARIFPGGTAYITDLGMTGPYDSILGMDKAMVIKKIMSQRPVRLEVAKGPVQIEAVVLNMDENTNKVNGIERISQVLSQ